MDVGGGKVVVPELLHKALHSTCVCRVRHPFDLGTQQSANHFRLYTSDAVATAQLTLEPGCVCV